MSVCVSVKLELEFIIISLYFTRMPLRITEGTSCLCCYTHITCLLAVCSYIACALEDLFPENLFLSHSRALVFTLCLNFYLSS